MKSYEKIKAMLSHHSAQVVALKREHNSLDQISMLSGEGNKLREEINQSKGIVRALNWVLIENLPEL